MLNGYEIILVFLIILLLFGAKKLPELAQGLGRGIREFKKASQDLATDWPAKLYDSEDSEKRPPSTKPTKNEVASNREVPGS